MRRLLALVAAVTALVLVAGCGGPTLSSLPLPGNGVSGKTITVKATFAEALNLAQGASVRVDGVTSGRVVSVTAQDFHAVVTMKIRTDARLRADASARLRYTTPLGELFVDVSNPDSGALMTDGGELSRKRTSTAPTVEDALSSASMLINGGGLNQLQTITTEANKALGGRETTIRDLLARSDALLGQVNASDGDFDRTLRALAQVSTTLDARRTVIHRAIRDVRPAAKVLRQNTANLNALLTSLDRFAATADGTVRATRAQILDLVRQAGPVLQELVNVRPVLPATLHAILALRTILDRVVPGDYLQLGTHLRLDQGATSLGDLGIGTLVGGSSSSAASTGAKPGALGGLSGLSQLGKDIGDGVTQGLVQGLLGGTKSGSGKGSGKGAGTSPAPPSTPGGLLGGLLDGLGGGR